MKYLLLIAICFVFLSNSIINAYPISKKKAIEIVKNIPSVKDNHLELDYICKAEKIFDYNTGKLIGTYYTVKMKKFRCVMVNVYNGKLMIADSTHWYIPFNESEPEFWHYNADYYF